MLGGFESWGGGFDDLSLAFFCPQFVFFFLLRDIFPVRASLKAAGFRSLNNPRHLIVVVRDQWVSPILQSAEIKPPFFV